MHKHGLTVAVLVLLVGAATSCSDQADPEVGSIEIAVATTGFLSGPVNYTIKIDNEAALAIATTGSLIQTGLSIGNHTVLLEGIASNCTLNGDNPRTATVANGATTDVDFDVQCTSPCPPIVAPAASYLWHSTPMVTRSLSASVCGRGPDAVIS